MTSRFLTQKGGKMTLPENDSQILKLSDEFYKRYPNPPNVEILKKQKRAYNCLLFQTHYNYFICIPYRSNISHPYSFLFRKSKRSTISKSGLDYTKILILNKTKYLDSKDALIDKDEFNETMCNLDKIKKDALTYVEDYVAILKKKKTIHPSEFKRKYGRSSLKYFHKELGISV